MKKLVLLGTMLALVGCGSTPEPTGDMETDLTALYDAEKVEIMGDQLVITLPLYDGANESQMIFKSFHNMGNSLNYLLEKQKIDASKVYYMYSSNMQDQHGNLSTANLFGVAFDTEDLKRVYQGDDLPFQTYLPYADMDYKIQYAREAVGAWCADQDDTTNYDNVCS